MYRGFAKRIVDLVIGFIALILIAPILLLVALVVRGSMGSPVLFRQTRAGLLGSPFRIMKFRTMTPGVATDDASRLTRTGRLLRSMSLDELPQLFNVLKGDMSLVGPRPLLMQYLPRYSREQARRQDVRPGITGWAQVNGRNALSWEEKFRLDVWYVDRVSFPLDCWILCLTVWSLLTRRGISQQGHATAEEFRGQPAS
jgi:sugar transferase EpsL